MENTATLAIEAKIKNQSADPEHDDDLVSIETAVKITGLSRATIYRLLADSSSDYPRPLALSVRRRKFIRGELKSWRARRVAERGRAA